MSTESKPMEKKKAGPKAKPVDLHVKKPKVAAKPSKPSVPVEEHSDKSIRRNHAGRAVIRELLDDLKALDSEAFPQAPAFDDEGRCRMKFEGAESIKWQDLADMAPAAFESMHL